METPARGIWTLVWGNPEIDPQDLARAIQETALGQELDFRTRLLIRDGVDALKSHWGEQGLDQWLRHSPARTRIEQIHSEDFEEVGFPSLAGRLMDKTDPETVKQYFRELSLHVHKPLRIDVAGSIALIVPEILIRSTEDIDIVDEVPADLRNQFRLLEDLQKRYGLELGHVQSHYLPTGWSERLHYHDTYGNLTVYFADPYDIFLGKLTSIRTKDRDDLRKLAPKLDKIVLIEQLKKTMQSTLASEELRKRAEQNWYVVFGESLPT